MAGHSVEKPPSTQLEVLKLEVRLLRSLEIFPPELNPGAVDADRWLGLGGPIESQTL